MEVAFDQLGGMCWQCFQVQAQTKVIEVVHRGRASTLKLPGKRRNRGKSKGSAENRKIRKHAEIAALKRLRALYPDVYRLLYDEERLTRGLPVITPGDREALTGDASAFYAALTSAGVDIASYTP